jgi:hypothetical protein
MEKSIEDNNSDKISLAELEDMLKEGKTPPGIKEYDDVPPEYEQISSESKISKIKKVIF